MGDFYQTGLITTLHRLVRRPLERLEAELEGFAPSRPLALVLPCLYSELQGDALKRIIQELQSVRYLKEIVVTLGRTRKEEFEQAREFFSQLPQQTMLIWNDGQRLQDLYRLLEGQDLRVGEDGKGRSVWMAYGYILACNRSQFIALHDCDVLTYNRELLARLCYPVMNPNLDYEFCKGYYSRVTSALPDFHARLREAVELDNR